MYVKELMNLNLIFIQIHAKDTIAKGVKPNIFLKVAVGAGKNLLIVGIWIYWIQGQKGCATVII